MKKKEKIISLYLQGKTPEQIEEESGASSKYVKRLIKERLRGPSQVNLSGYIESFQGTIISGQYNVIGDINIEENRTLLVQCPLNGGIYGVKAEDVC